MLKGEKVGEFVENPIFDDMADEYRFLTLVIIYDDKYDEYDFSDLYEKYDILDRMA